MIRVSYAGKEVELEPTDGKGGLQALGGLSDDVVAVKVNGEIRDLSRPLPEGELELAPVRANTPEGLGVIRHSCAHLMASAIRILYPEARFAHGPDTEDGFFYDFHSPKPITLDDLPRIEAEMKELVRLDLPFERFELPRDKAMEWAKKEGGKYKVHYIEKDPRPSFSFYRDGDFVDLCTGPHVPSTGWLGAHKLLKVTGAYWLGDERNEMLTRVYGTAFASEEALHAHLQMLQEAERRDHRRLGKELDLFSVHPQEVGGGLIHFHPRGAMLRYLLEQYWYQEHLAQGYQLVHTPHIASEEIYRISGHLSSFAESMYAPFIIEDRNFRIKPMNCPGHILIYKSRVRSYRDLPLRFAEMGACYRFERSGVLHGLMRVRGFTIDDSHIFVRREQVEEEASRIYQFCRKFLSRFRFPEIRACLATRPDKAMGTEEEWARATQALRAVLERQGEPFEVEEGGGAFYGPKISLYIKDSLGRLWQCSTIQFDFNLPRRFDLSFVGEDNHPHVPMMLHRAFYGSVERFIGVLIEHYAGNFPLWLAPLQVLVLTVTEKHAEYAAKVVETLRREGFRAELNASDERISFKIREGTLQKIPFLAIVGEREADGGLVAPRERGKGDLGAMPLARFVDFLKERVASE